MGVAVRCLIWLVLSPSSCVIHTPGFHWGTSGSLSPLPRAGIVPPHLDALALVQAKLRINVFSTISLKTML